MNLRTPTATITLGCTLLALTAVLGWFLLVGPATSALGEVRTKADAAAALNTSMTGELRRLEEQRDGLREIQAEADELAVMFPPTADQPGFFATVTRAATRAGIGPKAITTLSPTAPVARTTGTPTTPEDRAAALAAAQVAVQTVTITVEASYAQAHDLLRNLERMDRSLLMVSVAVNGDPAAGQLVVSITGSTFVAPPLPEPDLDSPTSDG